MTDAGFIVKPLWQAGCQQSREVATVPALPGVEGLADRY